MTDFQTIVLVPLLSLGAAAIGLGVYSWIQEHIMYKNGDENEKIAVFVILALLFGFINILWFVPHVVTRDLVKEVVKTQYSNCLNTYTLNGKPLTEEQCFYFQDVLNGVYSEYTQHLNIPDYLGE